MEVLTYVPSNVILLISGYQVKGWHKVTVARNSAGFRQIRGIRGKNTRTRIVDTSAVISIELPQTELANEILSMVHEADMAQGTARLEITLADATGTSFFSTMTGYIASAPPLEFSGGMASNVWQIACDESSLHIGSARSAAIGIIENSIARLKDFVGSV